jgi:parallel beta helix pectate lyase-like protein
VLAGQIVGRHWSWLVTAMSVATVVVAVALVAAVIGFGRATPAAQSRTAAGSVTTAPDALYVGQTGCDDARDVDVARDARTPWCTLAHAARTAPAGSEILVLGGHYPVLSLAGADLKGDLTVRAADPASRPVLAGLQLSRVRRLQVSQVVFTGPVSMLASADVKIEDNGFASSNVYMRRCYRVSLIGNRFRDVRNGQRAILAQGGVRPQDPTTEDLVIRGNRFDNIAHDAIAVYNGYQRVTVEDNRIEHVWRPENAPYHSDAMQFMGGSHLTVRRNVLSDNNQGILVKDGRPSRHLVVTGNLIMDGGAGLQLFNAPRARVTQNTIWNTRWGLILNNDARPRARTSVDLRRNVLDRLIVLAGSRVHASGNVFRSGAAYGRPAYSGRPRFIDAGRGDYRIRRGHPGAGIPSHARLPGAQARLR